MPRFSEGFETLNTRENDNLTVWLLGLAVLYFEPFGTNNTHLAPFQHYKFFVDSRESIRKCKLTSNDPITLKVH